MEQNPKAIRRVYLAGPFFNDSEIATVERAEEILAQKGLSVFSPMRHTSDEPKGSQAWARELFEMDKREIDRCDAVVALYYGCSGDTGTAWECGYAAAANKPVVLVHVMENASSNLMMHCGCTTNIFLRDLAAFDFSEMPVYPFEGEMY